MHEERGTKAHKPKSFKSAQNAVCVMTPWSPRAPLLLYLRSTAYRNGPERFVRLDGHLHLVLLHHEVQVFVLAGLQHRDLDIKGRLCLCPTVSVALALLGQVSEVVFKLGEPVDILLAFPRVALHRPLVVLSFQPLWFAGKRKVAARGKPSRLAMC